MMFSHGLYKLCIFVQIFKYSLDLSLNHFVGTAVLLWKWMWMLALEKIFKKNSTFNSSCILYSFRNSMCFSLLAVNYRDKDTRNDRIWPARGGCFYFEHKTSLKPADAAVTINSQDKDKMEYRQRNTEKSMWPSAMFTVIPTRHCHSYDTEVWRGLILIHGLGSYSVLLRKC